MTSMTYIHHPTGHLLLSIAHETTQAKMEAEFKSDLREVEARLARGHRELETSLEAEIRRNGTKLEDMDDRYARSEEALRRAEERIGEVQEEVHTYARLLRCIFSM